LLWPDQSNNLQLQYNSINNDLYRNRSATIVEMSKTLHSVRAPLYFIMILGASILSLSHLGPLNANAQLYDNFIALPEINVTDNNNQVTTLHYEFLVTGEEGNNTSPIQVLNPEFGLAPPFIKLSAGQNYSISIPNDEFIRYTAANVKIAKVLAVSPDVNIEDATPDDPDTMRMSSPMDLGNYSDGNIGVVLPSNITPGDYILYVYLHYPDGITAVFSNLISITKG
jgi:hypothetical protein